MNIVYGSIPGQLLGAVFGMFITLMSILVAHGFLGIGTGKVSITKQCAAAASLKKSMKRECGIAN